ncbi:MULTISPECIES: tyrosine-type recombinase/integrase [unclassified Mesorhizobium]|uniref:tyrosine-type recombinase/integrase n=1 Tax=unclassified Mesorhizobium TaxID=325217 RepID=UPI00067F0C5F|nr:MULTISPECIES: tyrosine-type recombinase/integrase [unclassified Mesorhizobium]WJI81248.1 tyrosine-type recombinase/integrase [Mesorhizobium sp. C374B]WJI87767.1 tyrosine-type recombinase/integrase [Mesorhizobium sp. C372A]
MSQHVLTASQGVIKIGAYPIISLADAREKAREILRDIQLGNFQKREREPEITVMTLGEIVPQFIELYAKTRNRDWKGKASILQKFNTIFPKTIDTIKRADVVKVLDGMVSDGTSVRANRALAALKKLFAWCVDRGTIEYNPLAGLKVPTKEIARDRVLEDTELIACWKAAMAEAFPFDAFAKLLILTGQRRGEVAGMRWSELSLEKANWTTPAKRTKNATMHTVPLFAVEVLQALPRFLNSDFVFTTTGTSEISGFGRLKDRLDKVVGATDWRLHDIRRTVATNMAMNSPVILVVRSPISSPPLRRRRRVIR